MGIKGPMGMLIKGQKQSRGLKLPHESFQHSRISYLFSQLFFWLSPCQFERECSSEKTIGRFYHHNRNTKMEIETSLELLNRIFHQHFNQPPSGKVNVVRTLGDRLGHSIMLLGSLQTLIQRIIMFLVSVHGGHDMITKLQVQTTVARIHGCKGTALFHVIVEMIIFRAALFWPRLSDTTREQVQSRMSGVDSFGEFLRWFVNYAVVLQKLELDDLIIRLFHAKLAFSKQHIVWKCDATTCNCPSAVAFSCSEIHSQLDVYLDIKGAGGRSEHWPDIDDMMYIPLQMAMAFEGHFLKPQLHNDDRELMSTLFSENSTYRSSGGSSLNL